MTKLRLLAIIISLLGFGIFIFGLYGLVTLDSQIKLMAEFQRQGLAKDIDISIMRTGIIRFSVISIIVSSIVVISGLGMFWLKEWARKRWLATSILVALIYLYSCITDVYRGNFEMRDAVGYFIVWLLLAAIWIYLNIAKTKRLFLERSGIIS